MYPFSHAIALIGISGSWHQKMASAPLRAPEKLQKCKGELFFNFVLQFRCKHGESRGGWRTMVQKITHLHAAFSWLVVFSFPPPPSLIHALHLCHPSFFTAYQPSQSPCPHLSGSLTNASSCCFSFHSLLSASLCLSPLSLSGIDFFFFELWPGPKSPLLQLTQPILQPLRGGQSIQQVEWWSWTPLYPVQGDRSSP